MLIEYPHSLTHSLTHSLIHSFTHSLTHSLIHSLIYAIGKDIKNLRLSYETMLQLYRGIVPPIVTVGMVQSVNFPIYEHYKAYYHKECKYDYYTSTFLGGATSGSIISIFTIPFSFVKVIFVLFLS